MNNNGRSTNFTNGDDRDQAQKVTGRLRVCMYMLLALAFFRIFSLQFYGLMSDLIAASIVYCTYVGKGKIMAIFCLINAILGIVYSISIGSMDLAKLNKPQVVKAPNDAYNNNTQEGNNYGNILSNNYKNNNYQFSNGVNNNGNNLPNKNIYGINDANDNNKNDYGNNKYSNSNDYLNYNNKNNNDYNNKDNLGNPDNNGNSSTSGESRNDFMFTCILAVTIYSVVVYCLLSYFSYKAYETFKFPFGQMPEDAENTSGGHYNGQNYGGVDSNRNAGYSSLGRSSTAAAPTANFNPNFVPFGGAGQRLGE